MRFYEPVFPSQLEAASTSSGDAEHFKGATYVTMFEECIGYLSIYLQDALVSCAKCQPTESDADFGLPHGQLRLLYPYSFVYHHRDSLESYALKHGGVPAEHIRDLLSYIHISCGESFKAADDLFAHGLVTTEHIRKLFKPNTLILSKVDNCVLMLSSWPQYRGINLSLDCWSWEYEGIGVFRKVKPVEVVCGSVEPIPITDLDYYPIQYADPVVTKSILDRGRLFWSFKDPQVISYNGDNADGTQDYVSTQQDF